jgi:hypothetical protein
MYRTLSIQAIAETLQRLGLRIRERFPEASLNRVGQELLEVARESESRMRSLRRPRWLLRLAVVLILAAMIALMGWAAYSVRMMVKLEGETGLPELLQGLDAGVNEIILLVIALVFFLSLEGRLKRREALRALHELRSIAHVIDMHQLTKDPEALLSPAMTTLSSPKRTMTRFELSRYLDYCSEMLSLIAKLAALHAQHLPDPVVLDAVNDVETLAGGLSQKIWQKIVILDTGTPWEALEGPPGGRGGVPGEK